MKPAVAKVRYVIRTHVVNIERKRMALKSVPNGKVDEKGNAKYDIEYEDLGWFVTFDGSHEAMSIGKDDPLLKKGQLVTITIEGG